MNDQLINKSVYILFFCVYLWAILLSFSACQIQEQAPKEQYEFLSEGRASWYGKRFQGKPTASGEPFDTAKLTAAHRKLPLGTLLRVTNLYNNKSVVVRVNDRGPYHKKRILDLSKAAAKELDMINAGVVDVKIEKVIKK